MGVSGLRLGGCLVGGHPTGMHSCCVYVSLIDSSFDFGRRFQVMETTESVWVLVS